MQAAELRQRFLDFFAKTNHEIIASSSLIPANDPTLLFTNAGMVQFKEVFLGAEQRPYRRAASSQRCVRAGGKHNDLENVGYTARHHTFFEMLGNFSFGDYFKREAIQFAWQFLTEELKIPANKLWVTVFEEDDEAADIWLKEMKVDPKRFSRCGMADNFWSMGDTGPCGPCSEIFYDHGENIAGGPPGSPDADGDRYIEIWNMVFMQYERFADGTLRDLPKPSVDTGMGLERVAAVMQGVHDNYDIDLFRHLIQEIAALAKTQDFANKSLRVIADHIRSTSFLIMDGVVPSNEGRGYVLRRIIRRAIRHGNRLGITETFFYKLVQPLVAEMGAAYPALKADAKQIEKVLQQEEEQFAKTLHNGLKIVEQAIAELSNDTIPGDIVFKLYDTYGFPVDLTGDIARERGLQLDMLGFEAAMQQQRTQSKQASQFAVDYTKQLKMDSATVFTGYDQLADQARIAGLFKGNQPVETLTAGEEGFIVLDRSPFYAEGGGQVGDHGELSNEQGHFIVNDTTKAGQAHVHHGHLQQGSLSVGDVVKAHVDSAKRQAIVRNHSATHLLHAALRELLGEGVQQKGSLVEAERLRFDFSHSTPLSATELQQIEHRVNQKIRENLAAEVAIVPIDQAKKMGAMALFGEKYGDHVRVLQLGHFSIELCGGTHVQRTGDIGYFKIVSETGIAAGVRRIEAVSGEGAVNWVDAHYEQLQVVAELLKTKPQQLVEKLQQEIQAHRTLQKDYEKLKAQVASHSALDLLAQAKWVGDSQVLLAELPNLDAKTLRDMLDGLKQQLPKAVIVLASTFDNKVNLIAGVTDNLTHKIKAGEVIKLMAEKVGGKGGGRADMAQAGGTQPEQLAMAFQIVEDYLKKLL